MSDDGEGAALEARIEPWRLLLEQIRRRRQASGEPISGEVEDAVAAVVQLLEDQREPASDPASNPGPPPGEESGSLWAEFDRALSQVRAATDAWWQAKAARELAPPAIDISRRPVLGPARCVCEAGPLEPFIEIDGGVWGSLACRRCARLLMASRQPVPAPPERDRGRRILEVFEQGAVHVGDGTPAGVRYAWDFQGDHAAVMAPGFVIFGPGGAPLYHLLYFAARFLAGVDKGPWPPDVRAWDPQARSIVRCSRCKEREALVYEKGAGIPFCIECAGDVLARDRALLDQIDGAVREGLHAWPRIMDRVEFVRACIQQHREDAAVGRAPRVDRGIMGAVRMIVDAINNEGPAPAVHDAAIARLREEWPTLWSGIDALLTATVRSAS